MPLPTHLDRGRGCLLGLAIGDALGAPLEGLTAQQIRAHYGTVIDFVDGARAWRRKPFRWRLPGLYTDDTQQALALAEVLLAHGRIVPERLAELYTTLANPRESHLGAHRGVGKSFRQVIENLERGLAPHDCGQDSAGISAATRIATIGLFFADDPDAIFQAVLDASLITHRDVRSMAGALAVAYAVRRLLQGAPREPSFLFRLAGDVSQAENRMADEYADRLTSVDEHRNSMSQTIAFVESILDEDRDMALAAIAEQANRHGPKAVCRRPTMGFPPACIATCLYLLMVSESFEEALLDIVNLGGDADSAGAILGALVGAHYGVGAVPSRWLDGLHNRDGIELRADALVQRSTEGLNIPSFVETERTLSRNEGICRRDLIIENSGGGDFGGARYRR